MSEEFKIMLEADAFNGPLDLLLHLVQSYKVDIFEVPLLSVIEQYLDFVSAMQQLDLELVGDYMLMASQLMLIKSRRLLPAHSEEFEEETEELEEKLLEQIVEYQKIKNASPKLDELHIERSKYYSKARTELANAGKDVKLINNTSTIDLFLAFSQLLKQQRLDFKANHTIVEPEGFTIEEKIEEIRALLRKSSSFSLSSVFRKAYNQEEVITIFLAVLELAKSNQLGIKQEKNFGNIILEKNEH